METKFTVDYFIKKFKAIPDELWCIEYTHTHGKHCAWGHCFPAGGNEEVGLIAVFSSIFVTCNSRSDTNSYVPMQRLTKVSAVTAINNGHTDEYRQPTPKQRILAALYDIKKLQAPQEIQYSIDRKLIEMPSKEEKINSAPDFHFKGIDFGSVEKVMTHDIKFSGKQVNIIQN